MNATIDTTIVDLVSENPALVFGGSVDFEEFLLGLRSQVCGSSADMSKAKYRDAIKSDAYRVTRLKTAIDNAGKELTETHRREVDRVNVVRRDIKGRLDALRDDVRRPLDQWEEQEKARIASHEAVLASIEAAGAVAIDDTAACLAARIKRLNAMDLTEGELQEFSDGAVRLRAGVVERLLEAQARAAKAEAEAEELARLRQEAAERAERDRREAEARETKEREERAAREEAERKEREEELRREREIAAAKKAEERAKAEAERERQALIRKHEEELRRREAEAARQEAERKAAEDRRIAEERRQKEEAEARARDAAHRDTIKNDAVAALKSLPGVTAANALRVIGAIAAGDIPHVTIRF